MNAPEHLDLSPGHRIAYHTRAASGDGASLPGVVFLGGFRSDMTGTKALWLEEWCSARGIAFLRFDYRGHGQSSATFEEGAISDWTDDAAAVVTHLTEGPQVLVGSSMGGWIALRLAQRLPERIAGLVGIAAAPDFTEDSMWAGMDAAARATLERDGQIALPSDYSDDPYIITKRLIEDGRDCLVLRTPLSVPGPVRLLQGTADEDVDMSVALRLLDHLGGDDVRLTLVKGADHRFSGPDELRLISKTLHGVLRLAVGSEGAD